MVGANENRSSNRHAAIVLKVDGDEEEGDVDDRSSLSRSMICSTLRAVLSVCDCKDAVEESWVI